MRSLLPFVAVLTPSLSQLITLPIQPITLTLPSTDPWPDAPEIENVQGRSNPRDLNWKNSTALLSPSNGTRSPLAQGLGVIGPTDDREFFTSIQAPYRSFGRLEILNLNSRGIPASLSACTATLVGPRHVVTASHCVDRGRFTNAKVRFQPGFDGCESDALIPGGGVYAERIYATPFSINARGCAAFEDIAVLVLADRIGDTLGFLGVEVFGDESDDAVAKPEWNSYGYPADKGGGVRPVRQRGVSVLTEPFCGKRNPIWTNADAGFGMSGGPLWREKLGPGVVLVGVLSTSVDGGGTRVSSYSGGDTLVDLILRAKQEFP